MENYTIIRNAIHPHVLSIARYAMLIMKETRYYANQVDPKNTTYFAQEEITPNCFPAYGTPTTEAMMMGIQPFIEEITGKKLFPTYSYGRIYWNGSEMKKHVDRPSCEYSVTLSISIDKDPWPIWIDNDEIFLQPGDMVVYKGMEVEHWREPYKGNEQIQLFFHYVDADGPHADCRFDYRPMLGLPGKRKDNN